VSQPIDMSREAITSRLRELSRVSRLDEPFRPRVELSREAVTARIRELSELSRLCASLGRAGARLAPS